MSNSMDEGGNVTRFPREPHLRDIPARIVAPSEKALVFVVAGLIQQLGHRQAYNRLLDAAQGVRKQIPAPKRPHP